MKDSTTSCERCTDPDGAPCFPMYGLGPHSHRAGSSLGNTLLDDRQEALGFTPSATEPGMGVWWCPHCGSGKPAAEREHTASEDCWCGPELDYTDPETGNSVYVHRRPQ